MFDYSGVSILEQAVNALVEQRSQNALARLDKLTEHIKNLTPLAKVAENFIKTVKVGDHYLTDTGLIIRVTRVNGLSIEYDWFRAPPGSKHDWYGSYSNDTMENLILYKKLDQFELEEAIKNLEK